MLARILHAVVDIPQLRALILRIPLAELITMRENTLFRTGFFLVTTRSATCGIEFILGKSVQKRYRLELVAAGIETCLLFHLSFVDGVLHITYNEVCAKLLDQVIPVCQGLREVVPGIDMHQRERNFRRIECLCQYNRVLAA